MVANTKGMELPLPITFSCLSVPCLFVFQLVSIDDDFLVMMDDSGDTREDLRLPDNDLGKEILDRFQKDESFCVSMHTSFLSTSPGSESLNSSCTADTLLFCIARNGWCLIRNSLKWPATYLIPWATDCVVLTSRLLSHVYCNVMVVVFEF